MKRLLLFILALSGISALAAETKVENYRSQLLGEMREVEGVAKLSGGITRDIVAKLGKNNLSKGIVVDYSEDKKLNVNISVIIKPWNSE